MGNKIDDYLRKNYHKKVAYQDNYWLEMQAMLGPEKKDRKVIWLLLLLCVALSGYIIVDHLKDANQIRLNEKQSIVAKNTDEAASQLRQPSFVESERKENTIQSSSIKDSIKSPWRCVQTELLIPFFCTCSSAAFKIKF